MSGKRSIGKGFKWAWSTRAVSLGIQVVFIGYLTFYLTDVVKMNAALVGILLLASKIFDGVTDIIAGLIIDRTHSKWGQARPYQAFILPCWIFTILAFAVPNMGVVAQSVYVFILYTLVNSVFATFLNASDAIFLARSVEDEKERVSVTSISGALTLVGCIVFSIVFPQLVEWAGVEGSKWTVLAATFGIPLGILGLGRAVFCKEYEPDTESAKKEEKVPLGESIRLLFKNKYIMILSAILLLFYVQNNLFTCTQTYYFKYIVGNIGLASIVGAANLIVPIIVIFTPKLTRKFGTVGCLRVGMAMGVAGYVIRTIGGTNMVTIIIGTVLAMVSTVPITALINIYIVDCMDYGAWKNGKRIDGLISSVTAFGKKVGASVASGMIGLIMAAAGYDGSLAVQSSSAKMSIILLFNIIPLIVTIGMLLLSIAYNIDTIIPQIREDLGKE